MIIGVCGFTSTGSSAISDFLKEFNENKVLDRSEFTMTYFPDGLNDLSYHINNNINKYLSSNVAIERFRRLIRNQYKNYNKETNGELFELTDKFLNNIVQVQWKGFGAVDIVLYQSFIRRYFGLSIMKGRIIPRLSNFFKRNFNIYPTRIMEYSVTPVDFELHSKNYVNEILKSLGATSDKNTVLDQPFPGNNPENSFKYFESPIAIVVDRDPRDNYIFTKKFLFHKGRMIPSENVKDFVIYYKKMRENMPYKNKNNQILNINFEDLIYNYDNTKERIMDFCNLKEHDNPKSIFVPEMSINNTQMFKRYPELKEDIQYIEKNLKEYLYPFETYGEKEISGEMFSGKSPLNKIK